MFSYKQVAILVVLVTVTNVMANYTEEDIKNFKMVFCGTCKDETVKQDLKKYFECAKSKFPETAEQLKNNWQTNKDKADECFNQAKNILTEFAKNHADKAGDAEACFHDNVKMDHLAKCH